MKTKHTQGEWIQSADHIVWSVEKKQRIAITTFGDSLKKEKAEEKANAKLIAAAPNNLNDNIEWVAIHKELLRSNIAISKNLSDRIMGQVIKSKESIKKATE